MQKWEYRKFVSNGLNVTELDDVPLRGSTPSELKQLQELGTGGWELISVTNNPTGFYSFFLKRQLS